MNFDELTLKQIKEINKLFNANPIEKENPFVIGEKYLIRTVTMTLTGQVKEIKGDFIVLQEADWIADTGRFSESLKDQNNFSEVEPFLNDAFVNMGSIVDATKINTLIRKLK